MRKNNYNLTLKTGNSIYNCTPKTKYLGTNLIKYVQNLYVKNWKTLMKEIQKLSQKSYILYIYKKYIYILSVPESILI